MSLSGHTTSLSELEGTDDAFSGFPGPIPHPHPTDPGPLASPLGVESPPRQVPDLVSVGRPSGEVRANTAPLQIRFTVTATATLVLGAAGGPGGRPCCCARSVIGSWRGVPCSTSTPRGAHPKIDSPHSIWRGRDGPMTRLDLDEEAASCTPGSLQYAVAAPRSVTGSVGWLGRAWPGCSSLA